MTIPASDTKDITLEKIFDLEEGSAVQADSEGNYSLLQHGEGSDTKVSIEKVVIDGSEISAEAQEKWINFSVSAPDTLQAEIETNNTVSLNKTDLTQEVVSLSSAKINMPAWISIGVIYDKPVVLKKGATLTFPSYYTVSTDDSRCILNGKSQIVFNQDVQFSKQNPLTIRLNIRHYID